jgi:hypothetical protein
LILIKEHDLIPAAFKLANRWHLYRDPSRKRHLIVEGEFAFDAFGFLE